MQQCSPLLPEVRWLSCLLVQDEVVHVSDHRRIIRGKELVVEAAGGEGEVAHGVQVPLAGHVSHDDGAAIVGPVPVHQLQGVAPAPFHRPRVLRPETAGSRHGCECVIPDRDKSDRVMQHFAREHGRIGLPAQI